MGDTIFVKIDRNGRTVGVNKHVFQKFEYKLGDKTILDQNGRKVKKLEQKEIGKATQYPMRLGYAVTIHKSQGQTYDAMNFLPEIFAAGQLYVALSRCKNVQNIYLAKPLQPYMVRTSPEVIRYYNDPDNYSFFDKNEAAFYASSPYLFGLPLGWNFEFLLTDSYDNIRGFQEKSVLLDLDLEYKFLPHLSMLGTAAYRRLRDFANLPEFGLGFAFDYRDSKLDTRDGVYFEYMLTHVGAGEEYVACSANIESDESGGPVETESRFCNRDNGENYWELLTDARAYKTFGRFVTGATALVRYRPGEVKFYDYYYHGGANTFRGHEADSGSLGVHEALLTFEERFVLLERRSASIAGVNFFYGVQLVAGLDGSLLWDRGRPGWDDYEGAVYGGVHLVIPALDRIRFEVGYSPDRGEPVFYFGLFDKVTSSRWRSR